MKAGAQQYVGTLSHSRLKPFVHRFRYRLFYLWLDIDRLEELDTSLRLLSVDKPNLYEFRVSDHGPGDGTDLRRWAVALLRRAGVEEPAHIRLLTLPRILGYVFNPLSIWYCYDENEELTGVIHEVSNTFGDRHAYVASASGESPIRHRAAKSMHVSPFNGMSQEYRFVVGDPDEDLKYSIALHEDGVKIFGAGMSLRARPLNDLILAKSLFTHPLLTLKVIVGIHYQALKIWLKGGAFHRRPQPADTTVTVADSVAHI